MLEYTKRLSNQMDKTIRFQEKTFPNSKAFINELGLDNKKYKFISATSEISGLFLHEFIQKIINQDMLYLFTDSPIKAFGVTYKNLDDLAVANGNLPRRVLFNRILFLGSVEKGVLSIPADYRRGIQVTYKGTTYPSIKALADKLNLPDKLLHNKIQLYGVEEGTDNLIRSIKEDVYANGLKIKLSDGSSFKTFRQLCKHFHIHENTFNQYHKQFEHEKSVEEIVEYIRNEVFTLYKGKYYSSLHQLCREQSLSYNQLMYQKSLGKSIDECLKILETSNKPTKRKSYSIEDLRKYAIGKGGACISNDYISSSTKYLWECSENHPWYATWNNILQKNSWCPECYKKRNKI